MTLGTSFNMGVGKKYYPSNAGGGILKWQKKSQWSGEVEVTSDRQVVHNFTRGHKGGHLVCDARRGLSLVQLAFRPLSLPLTRLFTGFF